MRNRLGLLADLIQIGQGVGLVFGGAGIVIGAVLQLAWPVIVGLALILFGVGVVLTYAYLAWRAARRPPSHAAPAAPTTSIDELLRLLPGATTAAGGGGGGGPGGGRGGDAYIGTEDPKIAAMRRRLEDIKRNTPTFRVRIANAIRGGAVDCSEPFLDCAKLVITSESDQDHTISVALRPDGASPEIWLLRDGSREREFTLHAGKHVDIPLFVRSRRATTWNVQQPHGKVATITPGPCHVFDEAFQLSGAWNHILQPGRHLLAFDVLPKGYEPTHVQFNAFIPNDPDKSIWLDRG